MEGRRDSSIESFEERLDKRERLTAAARSERGFDLEGEACEELEKGGFFADAAHLLVAVDEQVVHLPSPSESKSISVRLRCNLAEAGNEGWG